MRSDLVKELNDQVEKLYQAYKSKRENRQVGIFLHQSINTNADEETLKKIIEDIKKHLRLIK